MGTVLRRRDRGAECRTCPVTIAEEYPEHTKSQADKASCARKVAADSSLQQSIRTKSEKIEDDVKNGFRGRGKRTTANKAGTSTVKRGSTSGLEMKTPLGVFWPESIYSLPEHFGEKIPPKMRQWRENEEGKKVVGIILPSSRGCL